ncbi:MAG: TIGR00645 family protein [Nitrospira sp.]|nr:TIGR00645 family protein [Nitrospira sp.]MCA9474240.1 TIGR00645 family protein [Nitrospira sp.]MCA9479060.1 TIGR00645 family protein [Nitrospira sp.]MDR4487938.1 TIGR00645 family protein [Nitrospirales bacterium]
MSKHPAVTSSSTNAVQFVERGFEFAVFASRWIQAPLYGGLIIAELLYAYKFLMELWHMIHDLGDLSETMFMLGILSLIDITMVANLLTMVVIGGYATFVSKLDLEGHPDRPDWLTHVDPGTIKIKLAASLIGISSIHLLKAFVNVSNTPPDHIQWQILIHLTFLGSAILLAWTDKLMSKDKKHEAGGRKEA